jgi:repressor LexA
MARKPVYLTETQKAILEFITDYQARQGISPTLREICERFNYSSYGTAYKHLKLLAQKGFLRRDWNQKRGLELLRPAPGHGASGLANSAELPLLGRIAAGRPIEAIAGDDTLQVPHHLLGARATDHYVLRVQGDSMIGEGIHDGDWVVVERRDHAGSGETVVALVGNDATLKRYYPEGERVRLQPANPSMQPIFVAATELQIQGVVVGLMRRF